MPNVIIYKQPSGVLAIIYPTEEAAAIYGIQAIAAKDVPSGLPYKIINSSDLPINRSQRNAWTAEDVDLADGVGSESNTFGGVQV